jgi:hypothetical protein
MSYPSIGAFLQCFKQPKSTIKTIQSFQQTYPGNTMVIISDGGYDYSDLCKKLNCIYIHEARMGTDIGVVTNKRENLIVWLDRLRTAAEIIQEDYIMILEDDVRVLKPVKNIRYTLNGINREVWIGKKMTSFLKSKGAAIPARYTNYYFGGCGGSIIRRQFILDNFHDLEPVIQELEQYLDDAFRGQYVSDYWLSLLTLYFGGTLGQYKGFCETWYLSFPIRQYVLQNITTLHFDKTLHNLPLTSEEQSLLGQSFSESLSEYDAQITKNVHIKIKSSWKKIVAFPQRFFNLLIRKIKAYLLPQ